MKRIIGLMLILTMLTGITAFAAEPTGYTESGTAFTQVFSIVNTNDVPGRTCSVAAYSVDGKDFIYLGSNKMLAVYEVTGGTPTLIQQFTEFTSNANYPMTVFDGNLYFSNTANNTTYRFPIGTDGMLSIDTANLVQYRIVAGYNANYALLVDDDYIAGADTSRRLFVAENEGTANVITNTTPGTLRYADVTKLSNGNYRFACLLQVNTNSDTIAIYDYDITNKTFTNVVTKTIWASGDATYPAASAYDMMFVDEDTLAVCLKTVNGSGSYIWKVDFTDNLQENTVTATKIAEYAQAATLYGQHFTKIDDSRIIAWGANSIIYNVSGDTWTQTANYNWGNTGVRPCYVANIGNTYYITADSEIRAIEIEDKNLTEYTVDRVKKGIINPGEVVKTTIDIDARAIAAATKDGKNIVYARDYASGQIYAYDVTAPASPSLIAVYDLGFAASSVVPMAVYEDNLIAANDKYVYKAPIAEDGSLGTATVITTETGAVTNLDITGEALTVGTAGQIKMYDISNLNAVSAMGVVSNKGYRKYAVEKATSHSYRVYIIEAAVTAAGNGTLNFKIVEVRNGLSGITVTTKYDGIPDLGVLNVWPSHGIYGEDATVDGYVGLKTMNSGSIFMIGKNTVRVATGTGNTDTVLSNGSIVVDCSDMTNPKVVSCTELGGDIGNACVYQAKIDDYSAIEMPQYNYNNGQANAYSISRIKNYDDPKNPKTTAEIRNFSGVAVTVLDNMAYATDRDYSLKAVKLYDNLKEFTVAPIKVTDRVGNVVTDVSEGLLTATAEAYNPDAPRNAVMVMGMYDTFTNKLDYTQIKPVTIPTGYSTISDIIDMEQLDNYSAYTKYLRVFIWDGINSAKPLVESKKIDAVTVEGTSFDIWIPENTETVKGLMLVHRHGMGESLKDMEAFKSLCADMDLAIMSFIDEAGLLKGFEDYDQCGEVILNQISVYAEETGHPELNTVPLATFGHSNSTAFAARFADYLPERMFAVIAYKSAYARQIEHDGITNNNIPMLIITGETDWAYGYADQIYAAERMVEGGGLVQYIQDPNAGHGPNGWMSNTIMFEFLKRAYEVKISGAESGMNTVDPKTGYYGYGTYPLEDSSETWSGYVYKYTPTGYMTYDEYMAARAADPNFKAQAWLFDKDYAEKWMTFNVDGIIDVDYAWHD